MSNVRLQDYDGYRSLWAKERGSKMSSVGERAIPPGTTDRGIALLKFTLQLLKNRPDGLRPQDIFREIQAKVPLDSFDTEAMKGSGLPRWRAALHFFSVAASKGGYLKKSDGWWSITDEGQKWSALLTNACAGPCSNVPLDLPPRT